MQLKKRALIVMSAGLLCGASALHGQSPEPAPNVPPFGESAERFLDTGARANVSDRERVVFTEVVHTPDAAWTRLFFSDVQLDEGSRLRVTSTFDGEVQELDAQALSMWNNSTAYFNGDTVLLELIAGPRTRGNRVTMEQIKVEVIGGQQIGLCGICGSDNRVPSDEDWAGRLANPGVCSAAVININSCLVSAGHCLGGSNQVIQFRVPNSFGNCNLQNPPVADQFPITDSIATDGGPGNDWAVMTTGVNNLGQTIYARYGEYRPIRSTPANVGQAVQVWGYGASLTCTLNHVQQFSEGQIVQRTGSTYSHTADTTGGNSGSAVLHNDEIIGVVTHCPCPNTANRIDTTVFANAIADLCPDPTPANNTCSSSLVVSEGATSFSNVGATTDGPDEGAACDIFGDSNIQSDVWFGHLAQCTGQLTISLCESSYNTKLAVYPFTCPETPGSVIACDTTSCDTGLRSEVTIPVTAGDALRIRVGGHNGAQGDGILEIWCDPDPVNECPSDLNGDGVVDVADMLALLGAWGECPDCDADFNGDGVVDVADLLNLLSDWGPCDS